MNNAVTLLILGLFVLGPNAQAASVADRAQVLASFSILGDLVAQLSPDEVQVGTLVGAGRDPHGFEPAVPDYVRVRKAALIFAVGSGFEPWLKKMRESAGGKAPVINVSEDMPLRSHAGISGKDPHFWQDPRLVEQAVNRIAAELTKTYASSAAVIEKKKSAFLASLRALDAELKADFAKIPADRRLIITSHEAFDYFGEAYELQFLAPQGWASDSEPSAKDVASLIRQIRQKKARALFVENLRHGDTMEQISRETGVRIGGTLYADSLSVGGGEADTYLKLMRLNSDRIRQALR